MPDFRAVECRIDHSRTHGMSPEIVFLVLAALRPAYATRAKIAEQA